MPMIAANWNPGRRQLRSFGIACVVAFGALGAWAFFRQTVFGLPLSEPVALRVAAGLGAVAATSGVLALAAPSALRPLYWTLTAMSLPIGWVVSHTVVAILFFGMLTPIGLLFRLIGRDPLNRGRDPARQTYWEPRVAADGVKRYYRQF
jgi:Saxitoxin biosynthesis operon protein SxtJ